MIFPSQFHPQVNAFFRAAVNLTRSLYETKLLQMNEVFLAQANPPKPHSGEQVRDACSPGKWLVVHWLVQLLMTTSRRSLTAAHRKIAAGSRFQATICQFLTAYG